MNTLGAGAVTSVFDRVLAGQDIAEVSDIAARTGTESHEVHAKIVAVTDALKAQSRRTLGMDAETFEVFSAWAWEHRPKETREAAWRHFGHGDLGALKKLGHEFLSTGRQWNEDDVLEADFGSGIRAYRHESGRVVLAIPGHGSMRFEDAVRLGIISVAKKPKR